MIKKLMLILGILFLIIGASCVLLGTCSWMHGYVERQERQAKYYRQLKAEYGNSVPVVYVIKDIEAGEVISADAVEERHIDLSKVGCDFSITVKRVIGRKAACDIPAYTVMDDFEVCGLSAEPGQTTTEVNSKYSEVDNIKEVKKPAVGSHKPSISR